MDQLLINMVNPSTIKKSLGEQRFKTKSVGWPGADRPISLQLLLQGVVLNRSLWTLVSTNPKAGT